jgi:hypothetical protein
MRFYVAVEDSVWASQRFPDREQAIAMVGVMQNNPDNSPKKREFRVGKGRLLNPQDYLTHTVAVA